jgi:hypothetical protein
MTLGIRTPFIRLQAVIPGTSNLQIDSTKVSAMFPPIGPVEIEASGHWLFGGDASSLTDLRYGLDLTPIASQLTPTYGAGFVTLAASTQYMNGLATPIPDAAEQTICVTFKYAVGSYAMQAGTLDATPADGGDAIYMNAGVETTNSRVSSGSTTPSSLTLPSAAVAGSYIFAAVGSTSLNDEPLRRSFIGNGNQVDTASEKLVAARNIVLGNGYYVGGGLASGGSTFAELICFPRLLSVAEIAAVYARSQTRMAARGITVL